MENKKEKYEYFNELLESNEMIDYKYLFVNWSNENKNVFFKYLGTRRKKELLENSITIHNILNNISHNYHRNIFFCVGDGKYPRSSYILSLLFPFNIVYCIDPNLSNELKEIPKNLICVKKYDYEFNFTENMEKRIPILVSIHSHGSFKNIFNILDNCLGFTASLKLTFLSILINQTRLKVSFGLGPVNT